MRKLLVTICSLPLLAAACAEPPPDTRVAAQPSATPPPAESPTPSPPPEPAKAEAPAPTPPSAAPTPPPAEPPSAVLPGAGATEAEVRDLEGQAGKTPAPPAVLTPVGHKAPGLDGAPGQSPAMGPNDAKVKVYVFSDFQCPVCRRVVEPMKVLARTYPKDVQIIFKHNALEMHRQADIAARAAIAAQRQGKFWEYHDKLFQNQQNLHEQDLLSYAEELKLDVAKFQADMNDEAVKAQVLYERKLAEALEARGTPGFFINGQKIVGWGSYGGVKSMVERALREVDVQVGKGLPVDEALVEATKAAGEDGKRFAKLVFGAE